jgi:DNA polymerase III subunit epsilon
MAREIVLDTETTGLEHKQGHRLVELGCVELNDLLPTGRTFHRFIDPKREIDPDAERVHGISNAFLVGKPTFDAPEVSDAFLDFIGDAKLIAHNAPFDRGFINAELERAGRAPIPESRWIDTLPMAQKRFPGMYNSLDALCKRYKISLESRDKHGGLIDSQLLAAVYLELQGGKERGLDFTVEAKGGTKAIESVGPVAYGPRPNPLSARSTEAEREDHAKFVAKALKDKAIWYRTGMLAGER